MTRRGAALAALALMVGLASGCVVSTQEGERTHVNAKHPDEIAFHFDTGFNKGLVLGRSGLLLIVAAWFVFKRTGGPNVVPTILGVLLLAGAIALAYSGFQRVGGYRVDVTRDELLWEVPGRGTLAVAWSEIEGLEVEGMARNVSMGGDAAPGSLEWSPQWEDLLVYHTDGRIFEADLRPLSVEQRGTLWRAIARKSELEIGKPVVVPTRH